jgi:hypothetical protein
MPSRLSELQKVYDGLAVTGNADDPGLYIVVPRVAHLFHLSVAHAYDLTIGLCILAAALIGAAAIKEWNWKVAVYFAAAVGLTAVAGDVYIFLALPAIAGIPWLTRSERHIPWIAALAGVCSVFRSGAALPYAVLLVLLCWRKKPVLAVAVIALAFIPSTLARQTYPQTHPFWHSVYIGLGWVHNSEVPKYQDEVGFAKVKALDPAAVYPSQEYETALRREVFRLARQEPWIIAENLIAKSLALILMISLFLFPRFNLALPFAVSLVVAVLPGIAVTPNWRYILAGISIACINTALRDHSPSAPPPKLAATWAGESHI